MKKNKLGILLFVIILGLAMILTACQPAAQPPAPPAEPPAEETIIVGFVYVGSTSDAGWSFAHDQGRIYMEEQLPWVETLTAERVPPGADFDRVVREMIQQGATVIFGTSFGYMDFMVALAEEFPEVIFMHCSGFKTAENMGTYFGRIEDPRFLSGMVAGLTTETNILGYVAAHPIPEVLRGINAFTLGARLVNPEAVVQVVWTGTWFDPAIEREAANALLDAGADVLGQHQDSPATQLAAAERGAFGTGNNWDMISMAPTATLTGPVWNWGPFYVETLESIRENTWTNAQHWLPIPGIVDIGPFNDALVPADVQATVMDKRQQIIDGEFVVFAGPITNQEGVVVVAEGQRMTDAELLAMNWFVEGVIGEPAN